MPSFSKIWPSGTVRTHDANCVRYCVQSIISGVDTRCNTARNKQAILWRGYEANVNQHGEAKSCKLLLLLLSLGLRKKPRNESKSAEVSGCEIVLQEGWPLRAMLREAAIPGAIVAEVELASTVAALRETSRAQQFQRWTHGAVGKLHALSPAMIASCVRKIRVE